MVGVVAPAAIVTVPGEMVTRVVSLLVRVIVTALEAGWAMLTGKAAVPPSDTVGFAGSTIPIGACTVTLPVASGIKVELLA